MNFINTNKAPQAIGPYSQGVGVGDFIFTSGQIALDADGVMNEGGVQEQTRQVLTNLREVLKEGGSDLDHVVKTTIFLANMDDFAVVNEVYESFFGSHKPVRSTIAVKTLPKNALVEIEAIGLKKS
ncbi:MAG: deaminase [Proteobacteria bacterium]|nr:MAG: deaminase [Pseudomonadota bacterium]